MRGQLVILSGNSNPALTQRVCDGLGMPRGRALVGTFSDGEIRVEIQENVRGRDVYVIQSACPPLNHHLFELLVMIDALKRASAWRITAVVPYYAYGRQDQKDKPRVAISARMVADMLTVAGAHHVVSVDLHAEQIEGFFSIPVDNLLGLDVLVQHVRDAGLRGDEVVVAPDAGGVPRTRIFAGRLQAGLAIFDGRETTCTFLSRMVGDVKGRRVIIVDDMVDSGRTLARAAEGAAAAGAEIVDACCVHPILSGDAVERLEASPLRRLTVTDTIPLSERAALCGKIDVVTIAPLLSEVIRRLHYEESVSSLFRHD